MSYESAYKYAIRLLAPRDYSRQKLKDKLLSREFSLELIDDVMDELEEKKYLDETRYAKAKIRAFIFKGWGPRHIEKKLELENIKNAKELVALVAESEGIDWIEQAKKVIQGKISDDLNQYQKKYKIYQKLSYKGYSHHIIETVSQS